METTVVDSRASSQLLKYGANLAAFLLFILVFVLLKSAAFCTKFKNIQKKRSMTFLPQV
ncbi:unnamed protein product [Amoebophrya sp. A25]|nr:unnamed protein product [Amoebophrya sp. A25]|eukprot:GSA25T00014048001.1